CGDPSGTWIFLAWHVLDGHDEPRRLRLDPDGVRVAGHRRIGPDLDPGARRPDTGQRQCRRNIHVGRKPCRRVERVAFEHTLRNRDAAHVDAVLYQVRSTLQPTRRLAAFDRDTVHMAFGGGTDGIETEQRTR